MKVIYRKKWTRVHRILSGLRRDVWEFPYRVACLACSVFPVKKNKIMIDYPFHRETIAVVERLVMEKKDYDIVLAGDGYGKKEGIRMVPYESLRYVYELATAGIWIDSIRKKHWVHKRSQQLYIQTWHGATAMKKVEKDAEDVLPGFYVQRAKKDSKMADYIVAETKQFKEVIQKSFWYDGKILEGEFKDGILDFTNRLKVINFLEIPADSHILLYTPTFRVDGNMNCYDMNYDHVINQMETKFGGRWTVVIRLHPVVANKSNSIEYSKKIINGTNYSKLSELIAISDAIVTDYSSCMFYGYRALKPVFIYASDFDDYMVNDRGGYYRYEELPTKVAKTTNELLRIIKDFDEKEYGKKVKNFNKLIGYYENDVMNQVVKIIDKHIAE